MQWVVLVVLVVALAAAYVTWLAARLDRLAARCESAAAALEAARAREELNGHNASYGGVEIGANATLEVLEQMRRRVELATAFHEDALRDDLALRRRIPVRLLGLSRRRPIAPYAYLDTDTSRPKN